MDKLQSMTDFILEQWKKDLYTDDFSKIVKDYATFLKQPLTLGMFVPCDENGNVLEEPLHIELYEGSTYDLECEIYQQAKERVIFEGCKAQRQGGEFLVIHEDRPIWVDWNDTKTIEDLISYNLTIT